MPKLSIPTVNTPSKVRKTTFLWLFSEYTLFFFYVFVGYMWSFYQRKGCKFSQNWPIDRPHVSVGTSQRPQGFPVRTLNLYMELFFTYCPHCFTAGCRPTILLLRVSCSLLLIVKSFCLWESKYDAVSRIPKTGTVSFLFLPQLLQSLKK